MRPFVVKRVGASWGCMMRRYLMLLTVICLLPIGSPHAADIAAGLTEALVVGTDRVVGRLGKQGGFFDDPKVRIPLPGGLGKVRSALKLAVMSGMVDDLELRMNRAAEQATPVARDLVVDAIQGLTFEDAAGILGGPDDSATRYLEGKTGGRLGDLMRPIVDQALADAGAVQSLEGVIGQYQSIPFAKKLNVDLSSHVVSYAKKAIFGYLAEEEAAIRTNPAARATSLLKRVFGG